MEITVIEGVSVEEILDALNRTRAIAEIYEAYLGKLSKKNDKTMSVIS